MKTYAVDMRTFRHRKVSFVPKGPVIEVGDTTKLQHNPTKRHPVVPLTARLFVGLSVGQEPTWTVEDVIAITQRVRVSQKASPDSSFLLQRGLYTDRANDIVKEDSVQVVIFNFDDDQETFENQMVALAETFIRELQQETVIIDLQRLGVSYIVLEVTP